MLLNLIERIRASKKSVLSVADIAKIIKKNRNYAKVLINRLKNKNILIQLERNKYALKDTNPLLISSNLIFPSYTSFLSAFSYYKITTQIPRMFHVVAFKQKKSVNFHNYSVVFVKFPKFRFFGFKRETLENKLMFMAEKEKAIVDSLYLPKYCPVSETFFALENSQFHRDKLVNYAIRMKSKATIKRLGFLLEKVDIDIWKDVKTELDNNYTFLNPYLSKKGTKNKKWHLIVNEVLK